MKFLKKSLIFALLAAMMLSMVCCGNDGGTAESETAKVYETFALSIREINKYGNVILETTIDEFNAHEVEVADILTVTVGTDTYDLPVGLSYSDVDSGNMICRLDTEDDKVVMAVNGGSFAETANVGVKEKTEEEPGYKWTLNVDKISFTIKTKGGYMDEYTVRNLERTNERADYSTLSDAEFANCREITCGTIKSGVLYRGTTPLDSGMSRDTYAMAFIKEKGVKSILNLADLESEMTAFDTYAGSYYASCKILNPVMDYKFTETSFAEKVRDCIKFIIENDGPYYIHCKEGKDRTGMLCAVLECYFGASYEEIKDDYMQTYINFYHLEKDSETYETVVRTNFDKVLCAMFDVSDLASADLCKEAKAYLLAAGLTETELASLTAKLSTAD